MRIGIGLGVGGGGGSDQGFSATTHTGSRAQSFSNANYFSETSGNGPQIGPSKTLVFLIDNVSSSGGFFWCHENAAGTRGFSIGLSASGSDAQVTLQIKGGSNFTSNAIVRGRVAVAVTCTAAGSYRMSVNGRTVQVLGAATYTPAIATDSHLIGNSRAYLGNVWAPMSGGVCEVLALNREATDNELTTWSGIANADNRMALSSSLTGDADVTFWWKAGTHWDGSAASSVSGGSSPVTFTKNGTPTLATATDRRFVFGNAYYHDSVKATASGATPNNYFKRDPFARVKFTTSATRIALDLITPSGSNSGVGLRVNGTFVAEYQAAQSDSARWTRELALSAGADKVVEIVEGQRTDIGSGVVVGSAVQAVREIDGATITPVRATAPASRLVVYGDSISVGYSATNPTDAGWTMLVRGDYPGGVTVIGHASRALYTDGSTADARTAFAATLVNACQSSAGTRLLWLAIGTNDYGLAHWNAANFGTAYADLLDKIRALDSSIVIYAQSPLTRTTETANAFGSTLPDYRTQIETAATARPSYVTYVHGPNTAPTLGDGLHPTTAGHATVKAWVKTTIGY